MSKEKTYKILTVIGARPQFIKAAALSRSIADHPMLSEIIVHSGQHYDHNLSGGFFAELDIPEPKYNLGIGSKSHNQMIGAFLLAFDVILDSETPDMVLVYGDTNTTAAAAIGAAKRNIPLAHVEAGLREHDKSIPEEVNKLLTDSVTDLFFSPTQTGVDNLAASGIKENVYLTGDISLDLLHRNTSYIPLADLRNKYNLPQRYAFMTCHRESNTQKDNLKSILEAVSSLDIEVLFSLHPRTASAIMEYKLEEYVGKNIKIIEPLGFWETQSLLKNAHVAITDSGGIIKEAYFHKTPGIIIDTQTEWIETIAEGWNTITGPNRQKIIDAYNHLETPNIHTQALGDGTCGKQVVLAISNYLQN